MNKLHAIAYLLLLIPFTGQAQDILLSETFSDGIPSTWTIVNEDGLVPAPDVSEFTQAWIPFIYGTDTCVASTSYYEPTGQAADYLITPKISLGNFSKINWTARSIDGSYPDGYVVLISTTDSLIASFTDTLMVVSAEANYFMTRGVELDLAGYANQDVYIAFKNNTTNGYILLFDQVTVLGAETARIDSPESDLNVTVFPNPTMDLITIHSSSPIQQVWLYNLQGELILESNTSSLSVRELPTGNYILLISSDAGIYRQIVTKGS